MSYSEELKGELARIHPAKACCRKAELIGLVGLGANGQGLPFVLQTTNAGVARVAAFLIRSFLSSSADIQPRLVSHRKWYRLEAVIPGLGDEGKVLRLASCCRRAFLRGAFLAHGSISALGTDYHLEFVVRPGKEKILGQVLDSFDLPYRTTYRRRRAVIYFKHSGVIGSILAIMGANRGLLDFETNRVSREVRGKLNRLLNCEAANLDRSVRAAAEQVEMIKKIEAEQGLEELAPALRQIADLRLMMPEASLEELAQASSLSKSAVNHRLRRLTSLGEKMSS